MNNDNNLDFDRFDHEDYGSNGYRKEMTAISDINNYENNKHTYDAQGRKIHTHHEGLVRSAKLAAFPFIMVFMVLLGIYFISPYIGLGTKAEKKAITCAEKATKYLGDKYKKSFSFTSKDEINYCNYDFTVDGNTYELLFKLNDDENGYFDNYQLTTIKEKLLNELSSKYNVEFVSLYTEIPNEFEKGRNYDGYFNKYFNGSNYKEVFADNSKVEILVTGDMPKDISKFVTSNGIKNIEIKSIGSTDRYNEFDNLGDRDADLESYFLDKAIIVEDSKISYYNYETVKVNGAYLVFKGTNYDLNMKPVVNKLDDKCSEVIYKGFTGDITGVLKGNIVNLFLNENKKVTINGEKIELEGYASHVVGKTKLGLENGHVKICVE